MISRACGNPDSKLYTVNSEFFATTVISPFCEGFIFTKLRGYPRSFVKIKPSRKFLNLQYYEGLQERFPN